MHQARKPSFKIPPSADIETSQHIRREKALAEQKRKRARRVDSSRNLDVFANLSLGPDDDEIEEQPNVIREGVASFATLLPSPSNAPESSMEISLPSSDKSHKHRKSNVHFANKIMYAELLEMKDDPTLLMDENVDSDGLPIDLDTNWVALAPVPQGKRCMAVSNQSAGVPGIVPNTFLKSRLKGRTILTFPSSLPPSTVLDCILDQNWKQNGILHVLDIIQWKGQEIGDCEANFRFWWRDTRLSELASSPSPSRASQVSPPNSPPGLQPSHTFPYPTVFIPVPYHLDLSYPALLSTIIPLCQRSRHLIVQLPIHLASSGLENGEMEVDYKPHTAATAEIVPDGLLLYVSQASYEPGTSPLSSWIPGKAYEEGSENPPLTIFERLVARRVVPSLRRTTYDDVIETGIEQ